MKKTTNNLLKIYALGILIFCTQLFPHQAIFAQSGNTSEPTIISFTVIPKTTVKDGVETQWNEFTWKTEEAERVKLYRDDIEMKGRSQLPNGDIGWPVSMKGGLKLKAKSGAVYKLVALNRQGEVSKAVETKILDNVTSTAVALPEIVVFNIKKTKDSSGDWATFYWKTKGAYKVQLFDDYGALESGIVLDKGNYGWPLQMDGAVQESLPKTTTYRLVATSKAGSVSESFTATIEEKSCPVIVTVTGKLSEYTDHINVYEVVPGSSHKLLFQKPVSQVSDNREGKDPTPYQRSRMTLKPGHYAFSAAGGGKEAHGDFSVIYRSEKNDFICSGGKSGKISFETRGSEY